MGLKGKLIASVEMKCGEGSFFDIFHINTNQVPNISPKNIVHFGIHEGESVKTGSIVSWKYNEGNSPFFVPYLSLNMIYLHKFSLFKNI